MPKILCSIIIFFLLNLVIACDIENLGESSGSNVEEPLIQMEIPEEARVPEGMEALENIEELMRYVMGVGYISALNMLASVRITDIDPQNIKPVTVCGSQRFTIESTAEPETWTEWYLDGERMNETHQQFEYTPGSYSNIPAERKSHRLRAYVLSWAFRYNPDGSITPLTRKTDTRAWTVSDGDASECAGRP